MKIVMIGTSYDSKGGIASVVSAYRVAGMFERWGIVYLPTHDDKGNLHKFLIVIKSYAKFMGLLARGQVGLLHAHVASRSSFLRKSMFIMLAVTARRPVIFIFTGQSSCCITTRNAARCASGLSDSFWITVL